MGGSKQKSTTTITVPPPTAEETRAKEIGNLVNAAQLQAMGFDITGEPGALKLTQRPLTAEEQEQRDFDVQLQKQIRQRLLGGPVDPETKRLDFMYRPYMCVKLQHKKHISSNFVKALVDSGSDYNVFPSSFATEIGIDFISPSED